MFEKRMDSYYFYNLFIHDRKEFDNITKAYNEAVDRINTDGLHLK